MNRKLVFLLWVGASVLLSSCAKEFTELNLPRILTVSTRPVTSITTTSAATGGNVTAYSGEAVTARGVAYATSQNPTVSGTSTSDGSGTGAFTSTLTGLTASTLYYVRAYATNSVGTAYGNQVSFTTLSPPAVLPTVTTTAASSITATGAATGGNVTADGGAAVTARGVAYGTAQAPTTANSTTSNGSGTGAFTSTLTGLTPSTLYYVRAYATNSVGTAYGNEVSFTSTASAPSFTCGTSTVTDVDGNSYATVQFGTQCWTRSNLKVSKYRNGDNIPGGLSDAQWSSTSSGAMCNYNNSSANAALYGRLYNWYAVNDSRGLCPTGWHVPTDGEWTTLTNFLGGESVAGGKMKSTATQPTAGGWNSPNTGATNSSGFTGLPGGYRASGGGFNYLGSTGNWWSSSVAWSGYAWYRDLSYGNAYAYRDYYDPRGGFSVRCARD